MNKLMGFYELQESSLPSLPWREYKSDSILSEDLLWTVRSAVHRGNDISLPRAVGVKAGDAINFANKTKLQLGDNGMVIFYPYFMAEKSGTLNIFSDRYIIEAVKGDLWNMVTLSCKNVTIVKTNDKTEYYGDRMFLNTNELIELESYLKTIRKMFRDDLLEGKSVLLEWSYAYNCNLKKEKMGERYLVFYEVRTV